MEESTIFRSHLLLSTVHVFGSSVFSAHSDGIELTSEHLSTLSVNNISGSATVDEAGSSNSLFSKSVASLKPSNFLFMAQFLALFYQPVDL